MKAVLLLALVACGSHETSAPGPVGTGIDLRAHLAPDVAKRAPADTQATRYEATFDIHGVKTKLIWYAFVDGGSKYLLSAHWEVATPAPSITITPQQGSFDAENMGTPSAVVEGIMIMVGWKDNSGPSEHGGQMTVRIAADGTSLQL